MESCSFCNKRKNQVETLVQGGDDLYICDTCIDFCHNLIHKEQEDDKSFVNKDFTSKEVKEYLDQYVVGQEYAKKVLSVSVTNHYKRLMDKSSIKKSNILMIGPSGSGKTYLVECLSNFLGVPLASIDATQITETGYIGEDINSIFEKLLERANGDLELAQKGIIFIDEIDKKAKKSDTMLNKDIGGEGVQQSLLKIIEGDRVSISYKKETVSFDTSKVLFVMGGAFVGIEKFMEKENPIGFGRTAPKDSEDITTEVLEKYGLIPELVGRLPILVTLEKLSKDQMFDVLTKTKDNLIQQYRDFFQHEEIELEFSNEAIWKIVNSAIEKNVGVRGLKNILETSLMPLQYHIEDFQKHKIHHLKITTDMIFTTPRLSNFENSMILLEKRRLDKIKKSVKLEKK